MNGIEVMLFVIGCVLGYIVCMLIASRRQTEAHTENERAVVERDMLQQQVQSTNAEIQSMRTAHEQLSDELASSRTNHALLTAALENEKQQSLAMSEQFARLNSEYAEVCAAQAAACSELERYKALLEQESKLLDAVRVQFEKLQTEYNTVCDERAKSLPELAHYKTALEQEHKQGEDLKQRMEVLHSNYTRICDEHTTTLTELERCRTSLEKEQKHSSDVKSRMEILQGEYNKVSEEQTQTLPELARYKTTLEQEQKRIDDLKQRLETLHSTHSRVSDELTNALTELERCKTSLEKEQQQKADIGDRLSNLQIEYKKQQSELTTALADLERYKTSLEKERQHREEESAQIKEMQEKHFAQFRNLAGEIMEQNVGKLKETNNESMDSLLKPLRVQLESLGKAVSATNETAAGNKASMEAAIKAMMEKTESLSHEAESLTLALRGNTKKQGDWGEMILERMLEESGLRKGEEYYIQENFKTEEGRDARPDVVIRFPDKRCVIIDSKVSLTAYALYCAAEKEEDRRKHLSAHVSSVRKHVDELAAKDYHNIVPDTISYVLMFMPNEASYMAALQEAPSLSIDAYRKKIVLISPTNLLMALQLAYNLWQKERQTRNVENIIDRATKLYDKLASVQDSFEKVGKSIDSAQSAYKTAVGQLFTGRGNYARQLEDLRQMGISPNKRLRLGDADESRLALENGE